MSRAAPKVRDFAARLIAIETRRSQSTRAESAPVYLVCEKLRSHLAPFMGNGGFHALLSRALALAAAEAPGLSAVHVNATGCLDGLNKRSPKLDTGGFLVGDVLLIAELLGLLTAFIGENLMLQMVREVWPAMSLNDFGNGGAK